MRLIIAALLALSAHAQPALDFTAQGCTGTSAKLIIAVPAQVAGTRETVLVPRCVLLGASLRLTASPDGGMSLEAAQIPTPSVRMVQDRIKLDDIPTDTVSIDHALAFTPLAGSVLWAAYRGQTFWTQVFDAIQPTGKTITVKLPVGRMLRSGDTLILMYLTTDPIVSPVPARP